MDKKVKPPATPPGKPELTPPPAAEHSMTEFLRQQFYASQKRAGAGRKAKRRRIARS